MGQGISSEELREEFNRFEEKINESSSLPLYLCFTLQIVDPTGNGKKNISKKLQEVVYLLEEKHISKTNRNQYALVLNDSNQFYLVNFCNSDEFINLINSLFSNIVYRNNDNQSKEDLYERVSNRLTWKKSIKILANLNLSGAEENKDLKDRLSNTFMVEIFDLKSLQDFDDFLSLFGNVAAKRIEVEKLTPQYKLMKDYKNRQLVTYSGYEESFDIGKIPLNKEILSKLDKTAISVLKKQTIMKPRYFYIEDVPFTNGVEVFCFLGFYYNSNNQKVNKVFKLAKYRENDLRDNFLAQVISHQLANEFSRSVRNEIKVEYLLPSLACIDNQDKIYLMEDYCEWSFHKFTNNSYLWPNPKWTEEEKLLVDFSHWTNEWTSGNLMVTDLQGWKIGTNGFVLTDPAIHSQESIFGKTDLGSIGFGRYFMLHRDVCYEEIWNPKVKEENTPAESDKTNDDKKGENAVRNCLNNDVYIDSMNQKDEGNKGQSARKSKENKAEEGKNQCEKKQKSENKDVTENALKRVESKEEPKTAHKKIAKEDEGVVIPVKPDKAQEFQEKEINENIANKKRDKPDEDNQMAKITKTEESNTIMLEDVIKILKSDITMMLQNTSNFIRIDKIQKLNFDLGEIEKSLKNKSFSVKYIASILFSDLNIIYLNLYDHYRNATLTTFKKNKAEKMPISVNSKLDELCRLGIKLFITYLSDESRSLNSMINIIVNFHLTLNLDEKSMEVFSKNSLPEYEQFIEKFANPEQKEYFYKLKKKFLLTPKMNNSKTHSNNQLKNDEIIKENNLTRNNVDNTGNINEVNNVKLKANEPSKVSEYKEDNKNDRMFYEDHTARAPLRNAIDFKTLKTRAMSSVFHNQNQKFNDKCSTCYLELILKILIDEFMFIDKHFDIQLSIIFYSRKDIEKIQEKLLADGKFKIDTIKKILSCLMNSYNEILRTYTIIIKNNYRCPERTINHLASTMTLFCEMMIELYEVFDQQLDKPYDIINLINKKQIHLKRLKDRANFYSKWLEYYHEFVLKYGNEKQKKENTELLQSHWNFAS